MTGEVREFIKEYYPVPDSDRVIRYLKMYEVIDPSPGIKKRLMQWANISEKDAATMTQQSIMHKLYTTKASILSAIEDIEYELLKDSVINYMNGREF